MSKYKRYLWVLEFYNNHYTRWESSYLNIFSSREDARDTKETYPYQKTRIVKYVPEKKK